MLILIAHGSRDGRWRASVECVVEALQDELGRDAVRLAYMEHTPPTLMDLATEAAGAGLKTIRVLPLFLAEEGHVERDIVPLVEAARDAWSALDVQLLEPMGQHPEFLEALGRIAGRVAKEEP
ncbi:MAG TPA: CbiX/SirB N-terminal domain-containing protein [Longimicrobiales bacterium]|jgi:sirohydrochlorin cobaltochelatase